MRPATILCAGLVALAANAQTTTLKYEGLVLSEGQGGPGSEVFKPTTGKIFVRGTVPGAPPGTRVRSEWIAVKARGAHPNYRIDSYQMQLPPDSTTVQFSLSQPTAGWPEGEYRVDLFIDDKAAGTLPFKVAK